MFYAFSHVLFFPYGIKIMPWLYHLIIHILSYLSYVNVVHELYEQASY